MNQKIRAAEEEKRFAEIKALHFKKFDSYEETEKNLHDLYKRYYELNHNTPNWVGYENWCKISDYIVAAANYLYNKKVSN